MVMLFQDHVVEVLKNGQSMTVKDLMLAIESKGIKARYNTVYFALTQLERFSVVSKIKSGDGATCSAEYKLKNDYEIGLAEQIDSRRRQVTQLSRLDFKVDKNIRRKARIAHQGFKQVGECARQQLWLNRILSGVRERLRKEGVIV